MSALGQLADVRLRDRHFRFGSEADLGSLQFDVRSYAESGH